MTTQTEWGRFKAFATPVFIVLSLTACATTNTNLVPVEGAPKFAPTQHVEILKTEPQRAHRKIATLEASGESSGLIGSAKTQIEKNLGEKARAVGADAVVVTKQTTEVVGGKVIYTVKGVAIKYEGGAATTPVVPIVSEPIKAEPLAEPVKAEPLAGSARSEPAPAGGAAKRATWIRAQNPQHYTVQLSASKSEQSILSFVQKHNLGAQAAYAKTNRQGEDWYVAVYGSYPNRQKAKQALAALPQALRKSSPWVRKIDDLQRALKE